MTAKAALCAHLLRGEVLNIKNVFHLIGLTNCPREISRMVEQPFGVEVSRTQREGTSKYGQPVTWYDYRLNNTEYNKEGIKKMKEYVAKQRSTVNPRTEKEKKELQEWFNEYQNEQPLPIPAVKPKFIQQDLFNQ